MKVIIFSLISGICTWVFLINFIPFLSTYFLVNPNKRSSHSKPIPTGGGIIFVIVSTISCFLYGFSVPLYCLPLSFIGFLDDKVGISAAIRYLFQIGTLSVILFKSNLLNSYSSSLGSLQYILVFLILLVLGTAIINFINFMDGLDGFLTLNMIIIFISSAILFDKSILLIVSSLIGFIYFNWHPAKVFMGDVGSTFLGAILFGILVNTNSINDSFNILVICFPLLADSFSCVIRRFSEGQNIFRPHKLHLYQRLNQSGLSHSFVTYLYSLLTLILAICSQFESNFVYLLLFAYILIGLHLEFNFAKPFKSEIS